ncbi:probable inactive leucine-rich repeat receptor-like protein kinase At3g03770 isoform X2 [Cynara cardunculus var. scolymus]|uniref:Concanavalin A-like lectin/glucanase, subgroup n=1 Tax=Cynara cardunculus var. scolymus TaxID=59895 RepID=A0A103YBR2_CYNCS|nr:probable inactive leucine-rich repeat receptor-like protein kinase At3g03770 isoform X2 [Cynara cardunculus var. scolymus]KVI06170.1 Concanavalin A-like lectin/glucanase, subgroup [Cynara cardunculus var. scolymus]
MAVSTVYLLFLSLSWRFFFLGTTAIQPSQKQVLLQLRKQLEYPKQLDIWFNTTDDFCYLSSPQVNVTCENNYVSELKIMGYQQPNKVSSNFHGFPVASQTLSQNFSMDSLIATLSRLTSLKVLSLVSLGIWGPLPDKIQRLYTLEYIDLSDNFLFGSIPPTFSRMVSLQSVNLDGNFLNGSFPDGVDLLSSLTSLSMRGNGFSGQLPDLPNLPNSLIILYLSKNSFSGQIPVKYSQLSHLQELDLSFNSLSGVPPASLFSLPYITYLNLTSNTLTGSLPTHLECGNRLAAVDISLNRFTGSLPSCLSNDLNNRTVKYDGNCLMSDVKHQHPANYCVEEARGVEVDTKDFKDSGKRRNSGIIVGTIVGSVVVLVLLVSGFVVLCRKLFRGVVSEQKLLHKPVQDYSVTGYPSGLLSNARFLSEAAKLGTEGLPVHRVFSFEELKEATNNFHRSTLIGEGSSGKIYKGKLGNGTIIAIRHLAVSKKFTIRNLKLRLDLFARLRHPHLVCLLGHCISSEGTDDSDSNKVYLVYEYVHNGNYRSLLAGNDPENVLKWEDRLRVLTGVAKAVHFLHTGLIPGFFNNRLKANNILLNEDGMAKLSDYGLSIIAEDIKQDANGEGAESWQMKNLEDDVYSFGFILLETLVGPSAASRKDEFLTNEMASFETEEERKKVVDPVVLASCSQESLSVIISITKKCFCGDSWDRPSFEDVLWHLQYAAQVQAGAHRPAEAVLFMGC